MVKLSSTNLPNHSRLQTNRIPRTHIVWISYKKRQKMVVPKLFKTKITIQLLGTRTRLQLKEITLHTNLIKLTALLVIFKKANLRTIYQVNRIRPKFSNVRNRIRVIMAALTTMSVPITKQTIRTTSNPMSIVPHHKGSKSKLHRYRGALVIITPPVTMLVMVINQLTIKIPKYRNLQ